MGYGQKQDDTGQLFLPYRFCHIIAAVIIATVLITLLSVKDILGCNRLISIYY